MDELGIRKRIRARLAAGQLRAEDGTFVVARTHSGPSCAACELQIEPADAAPYGHRYLDGEHHWFHFRCMLLWADERIRFVRSQG
jgi:hypothetical protein